LEEEQEMETVINKAAMKGKFSTSFHINIF
jgi:hypothetical protein